MLSSWINTNASTRNAASSTTRRSNPTLIFIAWEPSSVGLGVLEAARAGCSLVLSEEITSATVLRVKQTECAHPRITLSSPGGDAETTFDLLDAMRSVKAIVEIKDYCMSACAEIILPLLSDVTVARGTLIAFHGNPIMKRALALHYRPPGYANCAFRDADRLEAEYLSHGRKPSFWRWQLDRLQLVDFKVQSDAPPGRCPSMSMVFKHAAVAPSRAQLTAEFGLTIPVPICADVVGCVADRTRRLFGTDVVIEEP